MKTILHGNNHKKIIFTSLLLITISLLFFQFYNYQLKRKGFNIILNYGVESDVDLILFQYKRKPKNTLNTLKGTFVKDLVRNGTAKTKLSLTEEEMTEIKNYIIEENIMGYPNKITTEINSDFGRSKCYLTIYLNGEKKNIEWQVFYGRGAKSKQSHAEQVEILNKLGLKIMEFIDNKDEFKKLPDAEGGYL